MNANTEPDASATESADVIGCARALENASQNLCRATLSRPHLTPADVDIVLAHLAAAAAALPQAAHQISDILDITRHDHDLAADTMTNIEDPDLAIDTARLHLDAIHDPAVTLYRHLDAAHLLTAHISTSSDDMRADMHAESHAPRSTSSDRREDREPPPQTWFSGHGRGVSR